MVFNCLDIGRVHFIPQLGNWMCRLDFCVSFILSRSIPCQCHEVNHVFSHILPNPSFVFTSVQISHNICSCYRIFDVEHTEFIFPHHHAQQSQGTYFRLTSLEEKTFNENEQNKSSFFFCSVSTSATCSRHYPGVFFKGLAKPTKIVVKIASVPIHTQSR